MSSRKMEPITKPKIKTRNKLIKMARSKTSKKQLKQIRLDQERRRKAQEKRINLLRKCGFIFGCCL